jgi:DNA-binding NtrC family response regulator
MDGFAKRFSVLVVEDELSYRELYEEILADEYDLVIVASAEEAKAALRQRHFDVAVVDMRLKQVRDNVDGLDVLEFARALGVSTKLILKSGFPTQTVEIEARLNRLHPFAVLDKSADNQAEQLLQLVARAVKT